MDISISDKRLHDFGKKSFLLFILLHTVNALIAQDYHLQLHIEGVQFDSLFMVGGKVEDHGAMTVSIPATTFDATNWNFVIPDSIYNSIVHFHLISKPKNADLNTQYRIYFLSGQNGDTLNNYGIIFLDRKIKRIDLKYLKNETYKDQWFCRFGAEMKAENTFTADLHIDYFLIPFFTNTDFELLFTHLSFGTFTSLEGNNITYNEYLTRYLEIIEKYPDSRFLIASIRKNLEKFKTKEDLQKLYNSFSETNRQSNWGKKIFNYINNYYTFSNIMLPTWDTRKLEPVIQDSTRMNLIVFSASWCVPCHEMIPDLKEIYSNLQDRLDITYISIDEEKTRDYWRKLMREKEIPWRSLMAQDNKDVQKYNPSGTIPYALLVYPDKRMEVIDIRQSDQKDKLYSVCKSI